MFALTDFSVNFEREIRVLIGQLFVGHFSLALTMISLETAGIGSGEPFRSATISTFPGVSAFGFSSLDPETARTCYSQSGHVILLFRDRESRPLAEHPRCPLVGAVE